MDSGLGYPRTRVRLSMDYGLSYPWTSGRVIHGLGVGLSMD